MSALRPLHFSDEFVISCGTVPLDLHARKVLLILHGKKGEYLLPKGRKDVGEGLEATALRETYEETGFRCKLLPLSFPTLATNQVAGGLVTEPLAVTQRITQGKLKIILWYAAQADSTAKQVDGTQMEDEDLTSVWVDVPEVASTLTFEDDRAIASKVIELAFESGLL